MRLAGTIAGLWLISDVFPRALVGTESAFTVCFQKLLKSKQFHFEKKLQITHSSYLHSTIQPGREVSYQLRQRIINIIIFIARIFRFGSVWVKRICSTRFHCYRLGLSESLTGFTLQDGCIDVVYNMTCVDGVVALVRRNNAIHKLHPIWWRMASVDVIHEPQSALKKLKMKPPSEKIIVYDDDLLRETVSMSCKHFRRHRLISPENDRAIEFKCSRCDYRTRRMNRDRADDVTVTFKHLNDFTTVQVKNVDSVVLRAADNATIVPMTKEGAL